jgi:5-methylcytosine-specific restriction endonuclease McrA
MKRLTQDHFIPVAKGGPYTQNNIVPACKRCNSSKNDKDAMEWAAEMPFVRDDVIENILEYFERLETT